MSAQDFVPAPRPRLRVVLALLRVLAGRRGYAGVAWHGAGFTYRLLATRTPQDDEIAIDADPDAPGGAEAAQLLRDRLRVQP